MIEKRKPFRKLPLSPFMARVLYPMRFSKRFDFRVQLDERQCVQAMHHMGRDRYEAAITSPVPPYSFTLIQNSLTTGVAEAYITGRLEAESNMDITRVRGEAFPSGYDLNSAIVLTVAFVVVLGLTLLLIFIQTSPAPAALIVYVLAVLILGKMWRRIFSRRRELLIAFTEHLQMAETSAVKKNIPQADVKRRS